MQHIIRTTNWILIGLLCLCVTPTIPTTAQVPADPCAAALTPIAECHALVALYTQTDGDNWINASNWKQASANAPCDWFGVTCVGGRVVELALPRNRLNGLFVGVLADLTQLQRIDLAGNLLSGPLPPAICRLAERKIVSNLAYNRLFSRRADTRACLDRLDADWQATQTLPVRDLQITAIEDDAISIAWQATPSNPPGAYYRISSTDSLTMPFQIHGATSDLSQSNYRLDGLAAGSTYRVRIETITPAHSQNPSELVSQELELVAVTASAERVLLMVYFPADNDLSANIPIVVERLRQGSRLNPNAQVVALVDGAGKDDSKLLLISAGSVSESTALFERFGSHEINSADPALLSWFISTARSNYPATREYLSLMGHGLALAPELAFAQTGQADLANLSNRLPALPKGMDATPGDITDGGYMSTVALGRALAEATADGADPLDLIFFDQCFQGNLDTLYEVRNAAEMFVASPNYAWLAAPYDEYLALMAPRTTPSAVAAAIVARYQRNLNDRHPNVIFAVSSDQIATIAAAADELAQALTQAIRAGRGGPIGQAGRDAQYVDTTQCGRQNLSLGPPDELIGLGPFAVSLYNSYGSGDPDGVAAAAEAVGLALNDIVKTVRTGNPYLDPSEFWDYSATLTVLGPLPPNSPDSIAWRSSIYTETVPLDAVWTPLNNQAVQVVSSYAFVRDSAWDEFLASWFARERTATVGEWCHFAPPPLVESAELEILPLRVIDNATRLDLHWNSSQADAIAGHWIYLKGPTAVGWRLDRIVEASASTTELGNLEAGASYDLMIVARNAQGEALARSEPRTIRGPDGFYRLQLPLLAQ